MSVVFEEHQFLVTGQHWDVMMRSELVSRFDTPLLTRLLNDAATPTDAERSLGRGGIKLLSIDEAGSWVVRPCRRGGLLGLVNRQWYFDRGLSRPVQELFVLAELWGQDIRVVEPVAALVQRVVSDWCYRGVLITREASATDNLFRAFRGGKISADVAARCARAAGVEARKVVDAGVLHRDLHPANVLVTPEAAVTLVDFDRGKRVNEPAERAQALDFLVKRWNRAIEKRNLPQEWKVQFEEGLRRSE